MLQGGVKLERCSLLVYTPLLIFLKLTPMPLCSPLLTTGFGIKKPGNFGETGFL